MRKDFLWALFFEPTSKEQLIKDAEEILRKKYGSFFERNAKIPKVFRLLQDYKDPEAQMFAICFLMVWEAEFRGLMQSHLATSPQSVAQIAHFSKFISLLQVWVDRTIRFPYNHHNAVEIVENLVRDAGVEYSTGPHLPQN